MFRPLAISAIVLVFFKSSIQINRDEIFHAPLNGDGSVSLNWILDYPKKTITFEVHIPSLYGWFALGFSERGQYFPADYCLLWKDLKKRTHFDDTWSDTRSIIHVDKKQDCQKFRIKHVKNVTKFTFERQFDTCDFEDYVIEEGTTHVVWSRGADPLYKLSGLNITSPGDDKGMVRVQLLKNTNTILKLPSYVNVLDIVADKVEIPSEETTYWCHVHKLNQEFTNKHHVYRVDIVCFRPKIFNQFVHFASTKLTFLILVRVWFTTWRYFIAKRRPTRRFRFMSENVSQTIGLKRLKFAKEF
jgi:dopamine beta-monooxygenase